MKILLAIPCGDILRCRFDLKLPKTSMKYYPYPVRLAYATALLKREGFDAKLLDATAEELTRAQFIKTAKEYDIVIWETTASSFEYDIETMRQLRKKKSNILIGTSGYHATPTYKYCLERGYDFVIVGECDYSILDFARYMHGEECTLQGIAMKGIEFVPRPLIENLNGLPYPEREDLPMKKYNDPKLHGFNVVLIASRGCPWGCSFCTSKVYYGERNYRLRNAKDIVDEMEYLWNKYKPNELYFDDDNFAVNFLHVSDICNEILRRKLKVKWNAMVDANVNYITLEQMKKAGCTGVTIGAESADDKVLKHIAKGITRADIAKFVNNCKKLKLRSHVAWVLGLPYATKESDMNTIKFAIDLPSDSLQFSICVPYPGTEMYDWCEKNNYFATKDWSKFLGSDRCVINQPGYSWKEVEELHKLAGKLWYRKLLLHNPKMLIIHLYNIYKYQGIWGTIKMSLKGLRSLI